MSLLLLYIAKKVSGREVRGKGLTLNNLGVVYDALGKKQEALDYYGQALAINREVGHRSGEGSTLNNLGMVSDDLGKKQEALDYYEQALAIYREVNNRSGESTALWNIGALFFSQQCYEAALAGFLLARHIFEEVLSPNREAVQGWIHGLCQTVGDEAFAVLQAYVEPKTEPILQQALRQGIDCR